MSKQGQTKVKKPTEAICDWVKRVELVREALEVSIKHLDKQRRIIHKAEGAFVDNNESLYYEILEPIYNELSGIRGVASMTEEILDGVECEMLVIGGKLQLRRLGFMEEDDLQKIDNKDIVEIGKRLDACAEYLRHHAKQQEQTTPDAT